MAQAAAAAASGGLGVYGSPMQFATGGPLHPGAGPGPANQFRYTPLGGPGPAGPSPGAMGESSRRFPSAFLFFFISL